MPTIQTEQFLTGEPWEEKSVKALWFHIVREQVQSGEIARVGAVPWAVYCAVKSHTNLETGNAFPSTARLAELTGVSHDTVQRALKKLAEAGLVAVVKQRGKGSSYSVNEKIAVDTKTGEPWATGSKKYVPLQFTHFVQELERLAKTGNLPTDKAITINLVVQHVEMRDGTVNGINYGDLIDKPDV